MVQSVSVLQDYGKVTAEKRDTQWYSQSQYYRTTVRSLLRGEIPNGTVSLSTTGLR